MNDETLRFDADDLRQAVDTLRSGGIILYPTDTIWGIGCDATNSQAVARIFALKQREESKSMITLFDCVARTSQYIDSISDVALDMMELSNKPLTLILDGAKNLAANLIATDGTIGIRVTNELFSHALCERFRKPIVSTSANLSGQPSPSHFGEIAPEIRTGVDYIVKFRQNDLTPHKASSIIRLGRSGLVEIIRQ